MKNLYKVFLLLTFYFSLLTFAFGQEDYDQHGMPSISLGGGVLTFNGDIGKGNDVSSYTYIRSGLHLNVEERLLHNWLGVSLNVMNGKIAKGERSTDTLHNRNFESSLMQFGLNITLYIQNKKDAPIIPYITTGIAFASLNANTDIKYNGDSLYYYWTDGSIRNLPQKPGNEFIAHYVNRDYTYETPLKSAASSAMSLPIGIGFKLRLNKNVEANLGATYHMSFTNNIDGATNGASEGYLYSYFSLTYNIFKKSKEEKEKEKHTNIDFSALDKADSDGDGVKDNEDKCPGTPKGVKVDEKGCPLDSDGDGVPDYQDKEPNTKKGAIVDGQGKTVTDEMILAKAMLDSVVASRSRIFLEDPSLAALKKLDTQIQKKASSGGVKSKIPKEFLNADLNKNGIISSTEITAVIDGFFDGSNDYTVEKIHRLIDFFFEQ